MLRGVEKMIWNNEFKKYERLLEREEIRREYDGASAKLSIVEAQIKGLPEDKSKWTDEQKRLEDQRVILSGDINGLVDGNGNKTKLGYKDQMRDIDLEVYGSGRTNEFPDGLAGINQNLDSIRKLQAITKAYVKTL